MTYDEQIEEAKQKIAEINEELKALRQKKTAVTDATELKAINKQINALQHEIGKLKSDIRQYASLNRDAIRDWREMVLGDMDKRSWHFVFYYNGSLSGLKSIDMEKE